jgi:DNA-binding response OmpR family regulator
MSSIKAKILIIDEDLDTNNLFKIFLGYNDFHVDAFIDPIDALYHFKNNEYDLILLDLKGGRSIDSFTIFQALKKIDENVIICFMTTNMLCIEQLREKISNIENYVIRKPILLSQLKNKIYELIL